MNIARLVISALVVFSVLVSAQSVLASNPDKPFRAISPLRSFGKGVRAGQIVDLYEEKIRKLEAQEYVNVEYSEWDFLENPAVLEEGFMSEFRIDNPYEQDHTNDVLAMTDPDIAQGMVAYGDKDVGKSGYFGTRDGWMACTDTSLTLPGGPMWQLGRKAHFRYKTKSPEGQKFFAQLRQKARHRQQQALAGKSVEALKKMDGDVDWRPSPFLKIFNLIAAGVGMVSNIWAGNKIGQGQNARWVGLEGLRQTSAYMNAVREGFVLVGAWDARYVNSAGTRADQSLNSYTGTALMRRVMNHEKVWEGMIASGWPAQRYFEKKRRSWTPAGAARRQSPLSVGFAGVPQGQVERNPAHDPSTQTPLVGAQASASYAGHSPQAQVILASLRAKFGK